MRNELEIRKTALAAAEKKYYSEITKTVLFYEKDPEIASDEENADLTELAERVAESVFSGNTELNREEAEAIGRRLFSRSDDPGVYGRAARFLEYANETFDRNISGTSFRTLRVYAAAGVLWTLIAGTDFPDEIKDLRPAGRELDRMFDELVESGDFEALSETRELVSAWVGDGEYGYDSGAGYEAISSVGASFFLAAVPERLRGEREESIELTATMNGDRGGFKITTLAANERFGFLSPKAKKISLESAYREGCFSSLLKFDLATAEDISTYVGDNPASFTAALKRGRDKEYLMEKLEEAAFGSFTVRSKLERCLENLSDSDFDSSAAGKNFEEHAGMRLFEDPFRRTVDMKSTRARFLEAEAVYLSATAELVKELVAEGESNDLTFDLSGRIIEASESGAASFAEEELSAAGKSRFCSGTERSVREAEKYVVRYVKRFEYWNKGETLAAYAAAGLFSMLIGLDDNIKYYPDFGKNLFPVFETLSDMFEKVSETGFVGIFSKIRSILLETDEERNASYEGLYPMFSSSDSFQYLFPKFSSFAAFFLAVVPERRRSGREEDLEKKLGDYGKTLVSKVDDELRFLSEETRVRIVESNILGGAFADLSRGILSAGEILKRGYGGSSFGSKKDVDVLRRKEKENGGIFSLVEQEAEREEDAAEAFRRCFERCAKYMPKEAIARFRAAEAIIAIRTACEEPAP